MKVPAERLRAVLGITNVQYMWAANTAWELLAGYGQTAN
jgi:hypothetical protein